MGKRYIGINVFDNALLRLVKLYEDGHRVIVCFSGGKDSDCCLELAIMAATQTGRLPVEVVMRDEEIMFPGTYEYAERVMNRPEVKFYWLIAGQPIINAFNRAMPYWWVFDPLEKDKWLRPFPDWAIKIPELNIDHLVTKGRFPPPEGKELFKVIGLRTQESLNRKRGLASSGDWLTKPNSLGVRAARPIFDWTDSDVWKAHRDFQWDYNKAYDVMRRFGFKARELRIAPPTLEAGLNALKTAAAAWPDWFRKLSNRLPGIRSAAQFGVHAVRPVRKLGEDWEHCCTRSLKESPDWIRERGEIIVRRVVAHHRAHSTMPFPQSDRCFSCVIGSWKKLAEIVYTGDPFCMKQGYVPYIEPEFFRPGAGVWGGKPQF
jgi:predicted phosphoadenosine phosphosulfate sulfurtransferase